MRGFCAVVCFPTLSCRTQTAGSTWKCYSLSNCPQLAWKHFCSCMSKVNSKGEQKSSLFTHFKSVNDQATAHTYLDLLMLGALPFNICLLGAGPGCWVDVHNTWKDGAGAGEEAIQSWSRWLTQLLQLYILLWILFISQISENILRLTLKRGLIDFHFHGKY